MRNNEKPKHQYFLLPYHEETMPYFASPSELALLTLAVDGCPTADF